LFTALRAVNLKLRRYVHQSISDLIDPTRAYTSALLLNTVMGLGSIKSFADVARQTRALQRSDNKVTGKGKYYRTSTSILAIFGDSTSAETRKFLQRTGALYASVPGNPDLHTKQHLYYQWLILCSVAGAVTPFETKLDREPPLHSTAITSASTNAPPLALSQLTAGMSRPQSYLQNGSRPNTQQNSTASVDLLHNRDEKHLDFHKLFVNQPDAHYFPQPVYGENVNTMEQDKIFLDRDDSDEVKQRRVQNIICNAIDVDDHRKAKLTRRDYLDKYAPTVQKNLYPPTKMMISPNNMVLRENIRSKLGFSSESKLVLTSDQLRRKDHNHHPAHTTWNLTTKKVTVHDQSVANSHDTLSTGDTLTMVNNKSADVSI
jgi:hypothetical protein